MNQYVPGQQVELDITFTNLLGVLTDPTTVTAEVLLPDGTVSALTVTHPSTGLYSALYTPPFLTGFYRYRFQGVGNLVAAAEGIFNVATSFRS